MGRSTPSTPTFFAPPETPEQKINRLLSKISFYQTGFTGDVEALKTEFKRLFLANPSALSLLGEAFPYPASSLQIRIKDLPDDLLGDQSQNVIYIPGHLNCYEQSLLILIELCFMTNSQLRMSVDIDRIAFVETGITGTCNSILRAQEVYRNGIDAGWPTIEEGCQPSMQFLNDFLGMGRENLLEWARTPQRILHDQSIQSRFEDNFDRINANPLHIGNW